MANFLELFTSGIMVGALYTLLGVAVVLVYKATRVVSLAHGQILAFGAVFLWFLLAAWHFPLWLALLVTALLAVVLGFLVERLTLRPLIGQPLASAFIMTLAVYYALDGILQLWLKGTTQAYPRFFPATLLRLGPLAISQVQIWSFAIAFVLVAGLALFFRRTRMGLAMRVTAEDHTVAQNLGVNVKAVFSVVWMISALVAAGSGILLGVILDVNFQLALVAFKGLVVALFGGLESLPGAIVAGLLLGLFESLSAGYLDPLVGGGSREVAAFIMLLFILLVRPYGLFGLQRIERL